MVVPLAGTWIETLIDKDDNSGVPRRSPRGNVD